MTTRPTDGHEALPLPVRPLLGHDGIGGRIKARPTDFVVEELPLYEPCGEGEHLYLRVRKTGVSHGEMMAHLRRMFQVPDRAIGFAGMKDKHAVTTQMISVETRAEPISPETGHERIRLLDVSRHRNRLKRGHLAGNRFTIRLRDVDPLRAPSALRTLRAMERTGIPATFGAQRFGYRLNNHLLGAMVVEERWEDALAELLGPSGTPWPEHQQPQREAFAEGDYARAAELWTPADRAELIAARAVARGESPSRAVRCIGGTTLGFWVTALSSAAFNRVLEARFARGLERTLLAGDLAWRHPGRATFRVTEEIANDPETARRLGALEIVPSGPIWGEEMQEASGAIALQEEEAIRHFRIDPARMRATRWVLGARRPLIAPLHEPSVESGFDDHGPYVQVCFSLPRGMFATVVLQELTGRSETLTEYTKAST